MGIDAQSVVTLRLARIVAGGPAGATEAWRMVTERIEAMATTQMATASAMLSGQRGDILAHTTLGIHRKRVRANKRRLSR